MVTKTYGAVGLLDYQAEIPVGRAKMVVNFSGGAITGYGIAPAEHTTSDPLVQSVIENSAAFKRGRIILMRATGQQDAATGAQPAATAQDNVQKKTVFPQGFCGTSKEGAAGSAAFLPRRTVRRLSSRTERGRPFFRRFALPFIQWGAKGKSGGSTLYRPAPLRMRSFFHFGLIYRIQRKLRSYMTAAQKRHSV